MVDLLDFYADEDLMAAEERDNLLPQRFVDKVEKVLESYGGRLGGPGGMVSMGQPSEKMLYWVADVAQEDRRDALLALEETGLWNRNTGFQA